MPSRNVDDFSPLRRRLRHVIFDHNTTSSRGFDIVLLLLILLSVIAVMMESMPSANERFGPVLLIAEWTFTILFMMEYFLRLWTAGDSRRYATSFFGIIDFLSWIPMFVALLVDSDGAHYLTIVRVLRLLRVFRILKLMPLIGEADVLMDALRRARPKIVVFLFSVLTLAVILGTMMYLIEGRGEESQFNSIPTSVYWTIVTITTVGFGDITPITALGKLLASAMMLLGYAIIAVPTGIVASDIYDAKRRRGNEASGRGCPNCGQDGHRDIAKHCWACGDELDPPAGATES